MGIESGPGINFPLGPKAMTMSNIQKTANEITCEFVLKCAQKHSLTLSMEDKSWTVFVDTKSGHKLCVSKTKGDAPKVDTTVDITSLAGVQTRGTDAPLNGRFVSLFPASAELIEAAIKMMASPDSGNLRPVRRAAKKAPVAFRLEEASAPVVGSLADIGAE
jgi:hypothetical protein